MFSVVQRALNYLIDRRKLEIVVLRKVKFYVSVGEIRHVT